MADSGVSPFKSLASWKSWWHSDGTVQQVAQSIKDSIDPEMIPGAGKLVVLHAKNKVTQTDLSDPHTSKVLAGVLHGYPPSKDPSAYMLGDSVLHLNDLMSGVILGAQKPNPVDEKARRDCALRQGHYLKMLLSYVRSASARTDKGRTPEVTYLKELALSKRRPEPRGKGSSSGGSTAPTSPAVSTSSTRSAVTIGLDGAPLSSYSSPPISVQERLGDQL